MTIATCQHCDQPIFWFARHSRWLHRATHSRYCSANSVLAQAEPIGTTIVDDSAPQPLAV